MFITISFLSVLMTGCGETETPPPPKQTKEEIKTEVKKEIEAEAQKKAEDDKKAEDEKAALKEEVKAEVKEEMKAEEEANKPKKKAAPKEQEFTVRVSVAKMPLKGRKARFEKAAKSSLMTMAGKKGFKNMSGSISWVGDKCKPAGEKCVWSAKATFKK